MNKNSVGIAIILGIMIIFVGVTSYFDYRGIKPQIYWENTKTASHGFTYRFTDPHPTVDPVVANSTLSITPDSGLEKVQLQWDKNSPTEVSIPVDKRGSFEVETIVPPPGFHTLTVTGIWDGTKQNKQVLKLLAVESEDVK